MNLYPRKGVLVGPRCVRKSEGRPSRSDCRPRNRPFSDDFSFIGKAPDIFEIVLKKLGIGGVDAVAIGDTPYDAAGARKANIATIGVLCGGFTESSLRQAGCVEIYPGPAALFARFGDSLLAR